MEFNTTEVFDHTRSDKSYNILKISTSLLQEYSLQAQHTLCAHACDFLWHSLVLEVVTERCSTKQVVTKSVETVS